MKNKSFNILFMIMMICLMFVGMKDVYADDPHCGYKTQSGVEFYVYVYHDSPHTLGIKGFAAGNDVNLEDIFVREDGNIYCPNTVFLVHDGGMTITYSVKTSGSSSDKATLQYKAGDSAIMTYNPKITTVGDKEQIEVCSLGGNKQIDDDIADFKKGYKSLSDDYSEKKLKDMTSDELKDAKKQLETKYKDKLDKNWAETTQKQFSSYCFSANSDYQKKLASWHDEREKEIKKYQETMDLIAKVQLEKGQITQDEYDEEIAAREDKISEVNGAFEVAFSKVPFSDRVFSCEGLIADELEAVLQWLLKAVRIAAPILVIVFATIDFSQAVMSNDKDALNKATSKVIKRAIAALALFLVPLFVSVAIDWIDDSNPNMNCTEVIQ